MVLIPAGVFPMGVPQGDRDGGRDEYPRHDVEVDAFYIDKYETTTAVILHSSKPLVIAFHKTPKIRPGISGRVTPSPNR